MGMAERIPWLVDAVNKTDNLLKIKEGGWRFEYGKVYFKKTGFMLFLPRATSDVVMGCTRLFSSQKS
jgi:hypothetical protein